MKRLRMPLILMVAGLAAKGAGLVIYRLFHPPVLGALLATYDPIGFRFAEAALPLFFDLRGIAPPPGAAEAFDVLLAIGFAAQLFLLGLAISESRLLINKRVRRPRIVG